MSSLYLHIPFCASKCPYCDFYSQVAEPGQLDDYVDLLCLDLGLQAEKHPPAAPLQTIFFGGGTPSLLSVDQIERLMLQIAAGFGLAAGCEVTLEANPGNLDRERLRGYSRIGINRLSLGVQSLSDRQLELLGRGHSAAEACNGVARAREAGFTNLSLDLMFARPELNCQQLATELNHLLALQPKHISLYGLSYESGTRFGERLQRQELVEVSEEEYADQYNLIRHRLAEAGFEHYEISNFALPGYRCHHNQVYWRRESCLAAGCGGHSFIASGWGERWAVAPDMDHYRRCLIQRRNPAERLETFDRQGAMVETIYLALRTSEGIDCRAFAARFGDSPEALFPEAFARLGKHLQRSGDRWFFQPSSWLLYDHLISTFF